MDTLQDSDLKKGNCCSKLSTETNNLNVSSKVALFSQPFGPRGNLMNLYFMRLNILQRRYLPYIIDLLVTHYILQQISHGDLKLANTLLDGSPAPRLKICDFGYSVSSLLHSKPKSITGTLRYIAPEVLSGTEYDGKLADVWSCGVTLYVMLVGAYPFANEKEPENIEKTTQRILGAQYEIPAYVNISKECRHLLSRIFVTPAKRIKIQEIKNNPWFLRNLPWELSAAAQASYYSRTNPSYPTYSLQSLEDIMKIVEEAKKLAIYPPLVSNSIGGFRWTKEKNEDDQEKVELVVEGEEEEDELEVAEENGYDKKVKEVYKSEGLSLSGVVRAPERSLVLNQFHSNHTDPSPLAAKIFDPSMFGLHLAERSTGTNHIHSYHDSVVSQSVTYAESAKNSKLLDSSMYVRLPERSVESNTSHSYHSDPSASQSVSFAGNTRNSELSYPSISNVRSSEKSIKSNVSHPSEPSEYQMQSPDSASELSDTKSWEKVTSFDPSISDVREAEKSIVPKQLHSYQNTSASKLHDTGLPEGSLDSKVLDFSISDVRSAEKSVVSSSHFDWRGWMGNGRAK